MKEYILICGCFNMKKRASEAFMLLFPGTVLPGIIKGKDKISKLAKELNNDHIKAISRLTGRFAYYIQLDGEKIVKEYDLVKAKRIA